MAALMATSNSPMAQWLAHMRVIVESEQGKECLQTMGCKVGLPAIDLIACRHFGTPVAPAFWYRLDSVQQRDD